MIRLALLSTEEAAAVLGLSAYTLKQHRHLMAGLPYVRLNGGQIKYLLSDVEAALPAAYRQGGEDGGEEKQNGQGEAAGA